VQGTIAHRIAPVRKRIDQALVTQPHAILTARLRLALILEILVVYAVTLVRLRRHNVGEIVARGWDGAGRATERPDVPYTPEEHTRLARRLGWAVTRTLTVLPTDSRCLVQSLVLKRLLAARSIPSALVIGARSDGPFTAHAWVECHSVAVLPSRGYENSRLVEL
jgi:hypothetical protein